MRKYLYLLVCCFVTNLYANNIFTSIKSAFTSPQYHAEKVDESVFPDTIQPPIANIFIFDPNKNIWAVYDKAGDKVGTGIAAGGKDFCADTDEKCRTVEGEFTVFRSEDKDCTSKTFPIDEGGGAPMPNCMFFYKGYAIHGSKHVPKANVSHGCIRVSEKAAEWMNKNYIKEGSLVLVEPYIQ